MARKLTNEVKQLIKSNNQLMTDYCNFIGISIFSIPKLFERNAKVLVHHDAVMFLSSRLKKSPDEILTEYSEADSKVMA